MRMCGRVLKRGVCCVVNVSFHLHAPRNQALLMCGWEPALNETELDNFCMR